MKKLRKAYIVSTVNGVVQIGNTVFHVATGKKYNATMKGCSKLPYVMVEEKSFKAAREALREYARRIGMYEE
jgi:hypothetical protein